MRYTEMAMMRLTRLGPNSATMARASTMPGMAMNISTTRMISSSILPPKYPEIAPSVTPNAMAMNTVTKPTTSEIREP